MSPPRPTDRVGVGPDWSGVHRSRRQRSRRKQVSAATGRRPRSGVDEAEHKIAGLRCHGKDSEPVDLGREIFRESVLVLRAVPRSNDVGSGHAITEASFIHQTGRQRRCESACNNHRPMIVQVAERVGPSLNNVIGMDSLVTDVHIPFVLGAEILIDLEVDLVANTGAFANAPEVIQTARAAEPSITCRVQTVAGVEVVRLRHEGHGSCDEPRWVDLGAECIPCTCRGRGRADLRVRAIGFGWDVCHRTKQAEIAQDAVVCAAIRVLICEGVSSSPDSRISQGIDYGNYRSSASRKCRLLRIAIVPTVVVPEDSIPGARRQHHLVGRRPLALIVMIVKGEEERLVLHNRTAKTDRALLSVLPVRKRSGLVTIIGPAIRIQRGVLKAPYTASVKLIGPGPGLNLDRSIAAPDLRIHRRKNQADFTDEIRINYRGGIDSRWPPRVLNHDAVPHRRDVRGADTGKRGRLTSKRRAGDVLNAGQNANQVQHVVADQRQVLNFPLAQHLANRRARCRQQSVHWNADFQGLRHCCDLQRKVQTHLLRVAELNICIGLNLKTR